jgi:TolB-like protein
MPFWGELRRRNVFKVGAAYLVAGWLLAQLVGLIEEPLALPGWFDTAVLVFLAVGFPIALLLAWAYEVTPEGIKKTRQVPLEGSITHITGQKLNYIVTGLLVLAVALMAVDNYLLEGRTLLPVEPQATVLPTESTSESTRSEQEREGAALPNSVAVIPFSNLSPNQEDAYFAAGIHDEILNQLFKLSRLNPIARTSVMQYAGTQKTIPEIARELNVETVMEGSVRYADGRVLVTVQLVDAETGLHLWSESYERPLSNIFAIQADIAMNVANALAAEFTPVEQASIERTVTESPAAYARYLRAQDLIANFEFGEAVRELERAIEIDPFAEAYADLAYLIAYGQITSNSRADLLEAGRRDVDFEALTLDYASRSLDINPRSGVAWTAIALTHKFRFRWGDASEAFARALELSPKNVDVLNEYAGFLGEKGDVDEAMALSDRARQLDPEGALTLTYWAAIAAAAGRAQESQDVRAKVLSLNPSAAQANMSMAATTIDDDPEAAERFSRTAETLIETNEEMFLVGIASIYRRLGLESDEERALDRYAAWAEAFGVGAAEWAQYYVLRGELDAAYESLEEAIGRLERGETELGYFALNGGVLAQRNVALSAERFQRLFARLNALKASN